MAHDDKKTNLDKQINANTISGGNQGTTGDGANFGSGGTHTNTGTDAIRANAAVLLQKLMIENEYKMNQNALNRDMDLMDNNIRHRNVPVTREMVDMFFNNYFAQSNANGGGGAAVNGYGLGNNGVSIGTGANGNSSVNGLGTMNAPNGNVANISQYANIRGIGRNHTFVSVSPIANAPPLSTIQPPAGPLPTRTNVNKSVNTNTNSPQHEDSTQTQGYKKD